MFKKILISAGVCLSVPYAAMSYTVNYVKNSDGTIQPFDTAGYIQYNTGGEEVTEGRFLCNGQVYLMNEVRLFEPKWIGSEYDVRERDRAEILAREAAAMREREENERRKKEMIVTLKCDGYPDIVCRFCRYGASVKGADVSEVRLKRSQFSSLLKEDSNSLPMASFFVKIQDETMEVAAWYCARQIWWRDGICLITVDNNRVDPEGFLGEDVLIYTQVKE